MNWLDKYQNKILIAIWSAIFLTCLFVIFSVPVNAATSSNTEIPYNVTEWQSYNEIMLDRIEIAKTYFFSYFPQYSNYSLLIWTDDGYYDNNIYRYVFMFDPEFNNTISNDFDFSSNTIEFYSDYEIFIVLIESNGNGYGVLEPHSHYATLLGNAGSVTTPVGSYLPRYPFYYDGEPILSSNELEVLISRVSGGGNNGFGHATGPINDPDNIIKDDNNNPIIFRPNKPTPTPFTPQPFNPPNIDTSTLETLVESLIDFVEYGFNYIGGVISGAFSNLLSNIGAWVDYIVESFSYGFNNVVKAIQNLATDFYNNMVSLFEPFYDFFNGVATFFNNLIQLGMDGDSFSLSTFFYNLLVPDPEDFAESLIEGDIHHVIPLVRTVKNKFVSLFDSFYNLTPTKVFLIPSFTWHGQTFNLSIDFSWYDDYKVYGDTIITGFLVIGYIYWFVLQLNSMFRGGNSIGHDVMKAGGKE